MDDLFEKLKAEPPVSRYNESAKTKGNDSPRRESLPALKPKTPAAASVNKSRSMSPINCKASVDEKSVSDILPLAVSDETDESPKKQLPTKAQQKLFEPSAVEVTTTVASNFKLKPFKVRIRRDNLVKLSEKFTSENANKKKAGPKSKTAPKSKAKPAKVGVKRKAETADSPPTKKERTTKDSKEQKKSKPATGFFIKLNSSPPTGKKAEVSKQRVKSQSPTTPRDKPPRKANVRGVTSSSACTTKATKFTRTQLIKNFGKRFFTSIVRIKRCRHPLMLTFELNARTRKQQAKNKSKNLSVSFKEQVEIIGCSSDTESNYSEENSAAAKTDQKRLATPARLKKVENGKVIDDIEFDPALFFDPSVGTDSSTPLRKKMEKKSYSPLKDDSSSSARSEQLKLANEKLPPCGLRRLRDSTAEDEDDEDDECEYIVPIELPEKRSSRANSLNNTIDSAASTKGSETDVVPSIDEQDKEEKSTSSFETAIDEPNSKDDKDGKSDVEVPKKEEENDSTTQKVAELSIVEKSKDIEHINGNGTSTKTVENNSDSEAVRDENETIKLVLENDSCVASPTVSFTPDSQENKSEKVVKDAIEKLSKDIEISNNDEKESSKNVKSIIEDKANTISI